METVKVYSPIEDKKIRENLKESSIWKGLRYHIDEISMAKTKHKDLYEYAIKFDGLKPVQVTSIKKIQK